jgi:hypothetical protein
VKRIAARRGVKVGQLRSFCRHELERTPKRWLRELRLAYADVLLDAGNSNELIAAWLGYTDAPHFCREFMQHRDVAPQRWRIQREEYEEEHDAILPFTAVRLPPAPPPEKVVTDLDSRWLIPPEMLALWCQYWAAQYGADWRERVS